MQTTTNPRTFPAAQPFVELLCRWLPPCELLPRGREGFLTIDDAAYMVGPIVVKGAVAGYRLTKSDGTTYDLPATLDSCECRDFAFRQRRGGCKHAAALRMILADLAAEEAREAALAARGESWDTWTEADDTSWSDAIPLRTQTLSYERPDWLDLDTDPAA